MTKKEESNGIIFVSYKEDDRGRQLKPAMKYGTAVLIQATKNETVHIKARGRAIRKAVDVSQIAVNKLLKDWEVKDVKIGTELTKRKFKDSKEEKEVSVSFIDIELGKK